LGGAEVREKIKLKIFLEGSHGERDKIQEKRPFQL
jgi:hypothetical protein